MAVTLHYFDLRGRAEHIRLILHIAEVEYTDKRLSFEEWKGGLKETFLFKQIPVYEEGDFLLSQSNTIARYLANKHGLLGSDAQQNARIDEAYELFVDIQTDVLRTLFGGGFEEKLKALLETKLPNNLSFIPALLERNGNTGFLVGDELTLADIQALHVLEGFVEPLKHKNDGNSVLPEAVQTYLDGLKNHEKIKTFKRSAIAVPPFPGVSALNTPEEFN
eukprot:TRINITY_DN669_c0_g1_i1.p1 TRINITY_DN669_c0_g1~~TRINITY_DN669_c0_g1_i1.p1  ORF type:complete len:220 (-),score=95.87 TRINITY_DN669_c0_g1_i1:171-830(-)